jgi:hypothetical protein
MLVRNLDYQTRFFNVALQRFSNPIVEGVPLSSINLEGLLAHTKNCLRMSQRPDSYLAVLPELYPIPPRSVWSLEHGEFRSLRHETIPITPNYGIPALLRDSGRLVKFIQHSLCVELSGGLDTSLIIGVLRRLGLDPPLVGALSDRYEFRTELAIQKKLAATASTVQFFPEAATRPFAELKETPVHAIPNKSSLFYYLNEVTARWAASRGYSFVLNGIGFDSILIDAVGVRSGRFRYDFTNLEDGWANDHVFRPRDVCYVNVASIYPIVRAIISMRAGKPEDVQKLWARDMFRDFIPRELSAFRYKACFGAVYDQGLQAARDEIIDICKVAHALSGLQPLRPDSINGLIDAVRDRDGRADFELLARLSYANWIYQLKRTGVITD